MKTTEREIKESIKKSIAHWKRMIAWVETQDPEDEPDPILMELTLGENWYSEYCALCQLFPEDCNLCPIGQQYPCISEWSVWQKVNNSWTYAEWLSAAEEMLRVLENIKLKGGDKDVNGRKRIEKA